MSMSANSKRRSPLLRGVLLEVIWNCTRKFGIFFTEGKMDKHDSRQVIQMEPWNLFDDIPSGREASNTNRETSDD